MCRRRSSHYSSKIDYSLGIDLKYSTAVSDKSQRAEQTNIRNWTKTMRLTHNVCHCDLKQRLAGMEDLNGITLMHSTQMPYMRLGCERLVTLQGLYCTLGTVLL